MSDFKDLFKSKKREEKEEKEEFRNLVFHTRENHVYFFCLEATVTAAETRVFLNKTRRVEGNRSYRLFELDTISFVSNKDDDDSTIYIFCQKEYESVFLFAKKFKKLELGKRQYDLVGANQIGQGNFSTVYLGQEVNKKKPVCIKVFKNKNKEEKEEDNKKEAIILSKFIGNPFIVQFKDFYETVDNSKALVMEYNPSFSCSLFDAMHRVKFTQEHVQCIMMQLLATIDSIHAKGYIHLDIKPENILINLKTCGIKLIDFGLALEFNHQKQEKLRKFRGTCYYMAPEIVKLLVAGKSNGYTNKADLYSAGVVMNILIYRDLPLEQFIYEARESFLKKKQQGEQDTFLLQHERKKGTKEEDHSHSEEMLSVLNLLLTEDDEMRPCSREILKHAWFSKFFQTK